MVPDQNGTALDFSGGDIQEVELSFNTCYWDTDNCTMIAYVQDTQTNEVKQGTKEFMAIPLYDIDVQAKAVKHPVGLYKVTVGNDVRLESKDLLLIAGKN